MIDLKPKPFEYNEDTELMWVALQANRQSKGGRMYYYLYAPSLKELAAEVLKHGLKDKISYFKAGYYMQTIPEWSRLAKRPKCVCKCGHEHSVDLPDNRDWRKAQGL